jgi:hypothetical protein
MLTVVIPKDPVSTIGEDATHTHGYLFATGVILCIVYFVVSHHAAFFQILHMNMQIRIACSTLLYRKVSQKRLLVHFDKLT